MVDTEETTNAPPPATPSNTSLSSLFPELLRRIFDLAIEGDDSLYLEVVERIRLLARASLVCRKWCDEAQPLMWRTVWCTTERDAQAVIESGLLGKYVTDKLEMDGYEPGSFVDGVQGKTAMLLLERIVRVKKVMLWGFNPVPWNARDSEPSQYERTLKLPILPDVTTLSLSGARLAEYTYPPTHFPKLRSLSLQSYSGHGANPRPYTPFSQLPFTTVALSWDHGVPGSNNTNLYNFLKACGSQLLNLNLFDSLPNVLLPLFATFTNLKTLTLECVPNQISSITSSFIAPNLETLTVNLSISTDENHFMEAVVVSLDRPFWKSVRSFTFEWYASATPGVIYDLPKGAEEVVRRLEGNGGKVTFKNRNRAKSF